MVSPVRGLRPGRAARERVEKAPKPAIVTGSPPASASKMAENTALTAASASDPDSEVLALRARRVHACSFRLPSGVCCG